MHERWRPLAGLGMLFAAGACSFAPPYRPPVISAPVAYKEAGPWVPAGAPAPAVPSDWWAAFGDPTLNALEARLTAGNPSLAGAAGRYDEARAYLREAQAGLFPQIGLNADYARNRQSEGRPLRGGTTDGDYYGSAGVYGEAGYELDLWGRVRNSVAAGKAAARASGDDLAAQRLSLQALLATSYISLRGDDQQIGLLGQTIAAYSQADAVTRRRYAGGIADGIDTGRSGAVLAEAQAQLADVRSSRALTEHAIASLVGTPASSFTVASSDAALVLPATPVGLPSALLQRRPDIAAAEQRMIAANRTIGVARAAFFPSLSLTGTGGVQNTGLPGLFTAPNIFWSLGPNAVLNLFDGGRRRAQVAVARAGWTQATADYRGAVLQAFQDVEDELARLHHLGDEEAAEQRAVTQAAQAERLSLNRYDKGAVDYLAVVTAQATALRTRRTAIDLATRRLQASVGLVKAVGGGWTPMA